MRVTAWRAMTALSLLLPSLAHARPGAIDAAVAQGMKGSRARGLAVAMTDRGRVTYLRSFGARNARGEPLTPDTIMYGASLTKAVVAATVVGMAKDGLFNLDQPLADLLPRPIPSYGNLDAYGNWADLADDPRWRRVTARHVLTHSIGFANFSFLEPDQKLRFHFEPGSHFGYSGEGMMLLQFAIDTGLKRPLGEEVNRRIFQPLGMTRTSLTWRPDFAGNLADGWTKEGAVEGHDQRERVRVAGSMDTSIRDMARFAASLYRSPLTAAMAKPQLAITTASQFPTLQSEAPKEQRIAGLSAGLGVITFPSGQGTGFFKGGHNDSTGNMLVCTAGARRCIVLLANDVRAEAAFPAIVRAALGETGMPWTWEYGALAPTK